MENQNAAMRYGGPDGHQEGNVRTKLIRFTCPADACNWNCNPQNLQDHLIREHQAGICVKDPPDGNTISWQVKLKPNVQSDSFFLCHVTRWGLFLVRELRHRHMNNITSRMYVQYSGPIVQAQHFQYELKLKVSETKSASFTGNVEHLSVVLPDIKSFFTVHHGEAPVPQNFTNINFTVTIRKKTTKSGTWFSFN